MHYLRSSASVVLAALLLVVGQALIVSPSVVANAGAAITTPLASIEVPSGYTLLFST